MTPTRTARAETTLQQRRRAFNSISLNNTRSDVHSEMAGRGAYSTVASRDKTEQTRRSNNTCRDHNRERLLSWLMSKDSVASCFIKDVLSMSESEHAGLPHYFLGRVPCRSISLVAVVVGATAYEKRIVYILDDGTGTIDCAIRIRDGEDKPESKLSEDRDRSHDVRSSSTRERTNGLASTSTSTNARPDPPLIPVGSVVNVQGKIRVKHNSRELQGDTIVRCRGPGEELKHWQRVTALHKAYYFLPERFDIPSPSRTNIFNAQDTPHTPKSSKVIASVASTPSAYSTSSSSATSSPAKSTDADDASPLPRLRHPSRLHSRDLTDNTFRIYVKHFMDNLRYLNFGPRPSESDLEEDSDLDSIAAAIDKTPMTPTKKRSAPPGDEYTPRLSRRASALLTPRPQLRPRPSSASRLDRDGHGDDNEDVMGCTLSFLLRVPELSNLARRVVHAEMRRREKTRQSQAQSGAIMSVYTSREQQQRRAASLSSSSTEGTLPKVKRLFSWAIRKLYQEGSIIIWDGSALSVSVLEPHMALDSSMLYRRSSRLDNTSSGGGPSRLFSRHGGGGIQQPADNDSMEDLSDPPSDEEAYASLSTAYLATQVERAMRSLAALQQTTRRKGANENTYMGPAVSRRRLLPLPGPTKEDITTHLKRGDDRWKGINGWAVQEALDWLRENGRVWYVSEDDGGRWELCS